jgi:hypothetical protein
VQRLAYEQSSLADADYLKRVVNEIAQGVKLAADACVPAEIGFGRGHPSS